MPLPSIGRYRAIPIHPAVDRLSKNTQTVLSWLLWHRNGKTGQCNPRVETLAKEAGCSVATASRALRELRAAGILRSHRTHRASNYELTDQAEWRVPAKRMPSRQLPLFPTRSAPVIDHSPIKNDRSNLTYLNALILTELLKLFLNYKSVPAAAVKATESSRPVAERSPAAAASPRLLFDQESETSASLPAADPTSTVPARTDPIPVLSRAMAHRLLAAPHPNPICQDRAVPAIEAILRAAPDIEATAAKIWNNHAAWMEEWKTQPHAKVPQLWAWLKWGHWENPPIVRKHIGRESLADQAIRRWRDRIAAGEKPF